MCASPSVSGEGWRRHTATEGVADAGASLRNSRQSTGAHPLRRGLPRHLPRDGGGKSSNAIALPEDGKGALDITYYSTGGTKPPESPLDQLRELDGRGVLEVGPDDLHPDRQPGVRTSDGAAVAGKSGGGWRGRPT